MSGRYAGWRRLKGDTDRPDLLDLGKRMLGYLDNQRRLSGVQTQAMYRELPDGSVVMARWLGNLPEMYVKEGGTTTYALVDGFFARPTREDFELWGGSFYGTGWSEAGYHIPLAALRTKGAAASSLKGYWHSNYEAELSTEAPRRFYDQWFGDAGLQATANVDWTGDHGVLHFFGPLNRYNDPSTYYRSWVFHNGKVLLDVEDIAEDFKVVGCAIAGSTLRVMVQDGITLRGYALTLVAEKAMPGVPVHLNPRLYCQGYGTMEGVQATLLGEHTLDPDDAGFWHPFHFNQRGDECRAIHWKYDAGLGFNVPYETVASFTDTACTFNATDLDHFDASESETTTPTGSISLDTGALRASEDGGTTFLDFPARSTVNSGAIPEVPEVIDYERSVSVGGWTRMFVDYRDNVPVYLECKPEHGTHTIAHTFSRTVNAADGTGYLFFDNLTNTWICPGLTGCDANVSTTFDATESMAYTASLRADWFQLDAVRELDSTSSMAYTVDVDSDSVGQGEADIDRTTTTERTATTVTHWLIHLDLRHKVLCYQQETVAETFSQTQVEASTYHPSSAGGGTTTDSTTRVETDTRIVLRVDAIDVETDVIFSDDDTSTVVGGFTPASFGLEVSAYTLLLETPSIPSVGGDVEDIVPLQLSGVGIVQHDDFAITSPHAPYGAWAVSGETLAYSYTIQQGGSEVDPADMDDQRHGFCSLAGVKHLDVTWPGLSTDTDDRYRRYSPICALSPFATRTP